MSAVVSPTQTNLTPQAGERYADFVRRAHSGLMQAVPDWEDRNRQVWDAWEQSNGEPLRERAQRYFDGHRFVPNVCYFSEHETVGRDGNPVQYSFSELADIVDEHNTRAQKHNYAALVERHTVDGPERHKNEPLVVGYSGAARLGMVGNEWAAFFDEHHAQDSYSQDVLSRKQRRSVEVNRYRDGRRPYFDPVAVLGADSPRLPLPVARYEQTEQADEIDRYSIMAPAQVSGTNTFIPNFGQQDKTPKYQDQEPNAMQQLTPDDIQAVVQAVMSVPEFEWVREQMQAGGQPAQPAEQPAEQPPVGAPPQMPGMPGGEPDDQYGGRPQMGRENLSLPRYSNDDDGDREPDRYSQLEAENRELTEKYSKLEGVHNELMEQHKLTRKAVVALERKAVDSDREMVIREVHQKYSHFVDLDEELDRCLYSRGSELNGDQFDEHIAQLERYAERSNPTTRMLPSGDLASASDTERYETQLADMVVDRYTELASRGEVKSWAEIEADIRQEQAGSGKN